jgi:transcriptional regulator with XRE-family HTH domain
MAFAMSFNYGNGNIHCMTTPGKRLRALRKEKLISQVGLANAIGIDQSTVSDIENDRGLSAENLMRLCDALETTPQYVMRGKAGTDDVLQQIKALISSSPPAEASNSDRMTGAGIPRSTAIHKTRAKEHNEVAEPKFGPALSKFFNTGKGGKNERSNTNAAPAKKRSGRGS